jgi:hypothetical protein
MDLPIIRDYWLVARPLIRRDAEMKFFVVVSASLPESFVLSDNVKLLRALPPTHDVSYPPSSLISLETPWSLSTNGQLRTPSWETAVF